MKRILSVLLITSLFAGNIELDGDVNVTGTIQSQTIESLLEQIAQLQEQIALLQAQLNDSQGAENMLETRVYALPRFNFVGNSTMELNLSEITGYDLDYAYLNIANVPSFSSSSTNTTKIELRESNSNFSGYTFWSSRSIDLHSNTAGVIDYSLQGSLTYQGGGLDLAHLQNESGYVDIILSVTAQFPN